MQNFKNQNSLIHKIYDSVVVTYSENYSNSNQISLSSKFYLRDIFRA